MKKKISILGSTGSVGKSTLTIINKKKDYFKINLLSANSNYKLICEQIKNYRPNVFFIKDMKTFNKIKIKFKKKKLKLLTN